PSAPWPPPVTSSTAATARPWSTSWRSCPSAPSRRRRTRLGARPEVPPAVAQAGPRVLSRLVAALEGGGLRVLDAPGALRRAVAVEILAVLDVAVTGGVAGRDVPGELTEHWAIASSRHWKATSWAWSMH